MKALPVIASRMETREDEHCFVEEEAVPVLLLTTSKVYSTRTVLYVRDEYCTSTVLPAALYPGSITSVLYVLYSYSATWYYGCTTRRGKSTVPRVRVQDAATYALLLVEQRLVYCTVRVRVCCALNEYEYSRSRITVRVEYLSPCFRQQPAAPSRRYCTSTSTSTSTVQRCTYNKVGRGNVHHRGKREAEVRTSSSTKTTAKVCCLIPHHTSE